MHRYAYEVQRAAEVCLKQPQVDCPVRHLFAPGIYIREIFMPAVKPKGTFVIGCEHKTQHFNIILTGRARVMMDGVVYVKEAPDCFISGPGVRKILLIEEDMIWQTIHANPTDESNILTLEKSLVTDKPSWHQHEIDAAREVLCR